MSDKNLIADIKKAIEKIDNKDFNVYFVVFDSKGRPSASLEYIYKTGLCLKNKGYNVSFLHAESEFVGVESWLGAEYAELPHYSIAEGSKDAVSISPSDFLFIPEVYQSILAKTKAFPCKRIVLVQNYKYLADSMPAGVSFNDLRINECITTSESLRKKLLRSFPYMKTNVVRPSVSDNLFNESELDTKKLIINVVINDTVDANEIIKPFYWKYPIYSWVPLRPLQNLPKDEFAKALRESFATIWCDPKTDFGYSAIEAMKCGNLVIGRVPEDDVDWLYTEDGTIKENGLWFFKNDDAQQAIAAAIQTFLTNSVPNDVVENIRKTVEPYTEENQEKDIENVYIKGIFEERKAEFEKHIQNLEKNNEEETK